MILLDIEKAFDTVWHKGLIYKLFKIGMPIYIIKIIQHYLKNRTFNLIIDKVKSKTQSIAAGVPQGSILGPRLFLYYINDIPKNPKSELALFADDTAILSSSWSKRVALKNVVDHYNLIKHYFDQWKIKINENKTEVIIFSKKYKKEIIEKVVINDLELDIKKSVKYLGVHLDSKLSFSEHIKQTRSKSYAAISALHNLMNKKSALSTKNKIILYKVVFRPIMLYACPIWSSTFKSNINALETIQNKVLRKIAKVDPEVSNEKIRNQLEIQTIWDRIEAFTQDFYDKIKNQNIEILNEVGKYNHDNAPFKLKYKLPHNILL